MSLLVSDISLLHSSLRKVFLKQTNPSLIWDKGCHLTLCLHLIGPKCELTVCLSRGDVVKEVAIWVLVVHGHPLLEVVDEGGDEGVHLDGLAREDLEDL